MELYLVTILEKIMNIVIQFVQIVIALKFTLNNFFLKPFKKDKGNHALVLRD